MPIRDEPLTEIHLKNGDITYHAYVKILYKNPHTGQTFRSMALIDTGADLCVIPESMAELIGHSIPDGEPMSIGGLMELSTAYKHTVRMEIPGSGFSTEDVKVCCVPKDRQPLLGVQTFLKNFKLSIDYPKKIFSLELPDRPDDLAAWGNP